jgi:hypothetical protein
MAELDAPCFVFAGEACLSGAAVQRASLHFARARQQQVAFLEDHGQDEPRHAATQRTGLGASVVITPCFVFTGSPEVTDLILRNLSEGASQQ